MGEQDQTQELRSMPGCGRFRARPGMRVAATGKVRVGGRRVKHKELPRWLRIRRLNYAKYADSPFDVLVWGSYDNIATADDTNKLEAAWTHRSRGKHVHVVCTENARRMLWYRMVPCVDVGPPGSSSAPTCP